MVVADISPRVYLYCASAVNFGVAIACIIYLRFAFKNMRWSRTYQRFLTAHDQPALFWTKFYLAVCGAVFTLAIGVLILIPHKKTATWDFFQLPELERNRPKT
jgi:hypothetical protein